MEDAYNAASDLIERNLVAHPGKLAFIDDAASISFAGLSDKVDRVAGYFGSLGLSIETRVMLCMTDGIEFVVACLGAIKAGLVPVMVNPLLPAADFEFLLDDSRAQVLVVSPSAWPTLANAVIGRRHLRHILVTGDDAPDQTHLFCAAAEYAQPQRRSADTRLHEACLWQYSSGSTGRPKGTIHTHAAVRHLIDGYPKQVLGLSESDVTFSAAKLFFGYGFGNSLIFPMAAGATAILMAERPTAPAVWSRIIKHSVTVFYGVPTLYGSLLSNPPSERVSVRAWVSAGELLPAPMGQAWQSRFSAEILEGIGSTEMFHIFMSNTPGDVAYGTTGRPLPGYSVRIVSEDGKEVAQGEAGELHIKGPTSAIGYWCNRAKTQSTFVGEWVRSGDTFSQDNNGRFVFCGRSDDMLKVSGIYVSPIEVEAALTSHPSVAEAAVVGSEDDSGLVKPRAFVVLREDASASSELKIELQQHVKSRLAPYKYPRWIEFVSVLPKTATGKIRRHMLRARSESRA